MKISRWGAAAAGLAVGALAAAGPASANHNDVSVDIVTEGCDLTATSSWASDEHLVANTVVVVRTGGATFSAAVGSPVQVELEPGTTTVDWRVWGGGERDYDDPALDDLPALVAYLDGGGDVLDPDAPGVAWHELAVEGCEPEPDPTPTATAEPEPTATPTTEPQPGETAAPGAGGEQLPTTGLALPLLAGLGVGMVGAGGALWWLARRRPIRT